jgi:hypothetical protein
MSCGYILDQGKTLSPIYFPFCLYSIFIWVFPPQVNTFSSLYIFYISIYRGGEREQGRKSAQTQEDAYWVFSFFYYYNNEIIPDGMFANTQNGIGQSLFFFFFFFVSYYGTSLFLTLHCKNSLLTTVVGACKTASIS